MSVNKYGGVNDMPDGFTKTALGKRIYSLWFDLSEGDAIRYVKQLNSSGTKPGEVFELWHDEL